LDKGQNVVVVEDLISTGKSSLNAVKALKDADAVIKGMVAIFDYGFNNAVQNFKEENLELTTLSDYESLIEQAMENNYISEKDFETLIEWRVNPSEWKKQ
jgi:orotate phosphoribosyltransferase